MKKLAIVSLSLGLAACASDTYITDVTSESYREDYTTAKVEQTVVTKDGTVNGITENNVVKTKPAPQKPMTKPQPVAKSSTAVALKPPSAKQKAMSSRYGYTIQVAAVGSQNKVDSFARQLPANGQPIWENYKVVNGTKWYTVLFGDYATHAEAQAAIANLPANFRNLKPFVKSIDKIKNSEFPTLNKLN